MIICEKTSIPQHPRSGGRLKPTNETLKRANGTRPCDFLATADGNADRQTQQFFQASVDQRAGCFCCQSCVSRRTHRTFIKVSPAVTITRMTMVEPSTLVMCRHPKPAIVLTEVPSPNAPMASSNPQFDASTSTFLTGA